jgi:hypothetical protein
MQSRIKSPAAAALTVCLAAGCASQRTPPAPLPNPPETTVEGTPVGDERTAMEAAVDSGAAPATAADGASAGIVLAPNAPESYVVKRGDTLWAIAKVFLRDPWYWPEIWQVNPQIQNPHLIYPGDTLRLVYIQGQPHIQLVRGNDALVEPRVRSELLQDAITTIPYETIAAFMSKPSVLTRDQIQAAPYVLAALDDHVMMSDDNTIYARGFHQAADVGARYNIIRVGDPLRDPDDNKIIGYDGIFEAAGRVTRGGDPATLLVLESAREAEIGDKLFPGSVEVPLDFSPSAPKTRINGRIMAVNDGVTTIGQYEVVVINRGARDGLAPGNILATFGLGNRVSDNEKHGFLNGTSAKFFAKSYQLPDERNGTFMVFKTFDRISYGLIMEAKNVIRVGDRIENP